MEPLTTPQQTVDNNTLLLGTLPWIVGALLCSYNLSLYIETPLPPYYRQEPIIPSRLRAVLDINVREMGKLLALMKLWESRSCRKVDDYRNEKHIMTRLRRFLNAMESLDLTTKIYELKGLSSHLNLVTQGLIRSPLLKAIDRITTWEVIWNLYMSRLSE